MYLIAPLAIMTAALVFHARNNPVPAATLLLLVTAAYGKTVWHEFLQHRRYTGTAHRRDQRERVHTHAELTHTTTRTVRDTALAVQPTTW